MNDNTRKLAKSQLDELLTHWQIIEFWLKKAEHVSKKTAVPAINELRYASRQLFNAVRIYGKYRLTNGDISALNKRMLIAEQYLLNADHDIFDSLHKFFGEETEENEKILHETEIRNRFPDYHVYKREIDAIGNLIQDARQDYFIRKQSYGEIRDKHIMFLINNRKNYISAVADGLLDQDKLRKELQREKQRSKIYGRWAVIATIVTIFSVPSLPFSIYTWMSSEEYCRRHSAWWATFLCDAPPLANPVASDDVFKFTNPATRNP